MKTKEIYKVAETHLGSLMEDISHMIDLTVNHLEKEVQAELKHMGIAMSYEMRNVFICLKSGVYLIGYVQRHSSRALSMKIWK